MDAKWTDVYYFIEYDWSTDMFQSFWLSDGFVTGYNHSIKNQTQDSKTLSINFLALLTYAMSLLVAYSTKGYFSWLPCSWANKIIRRANFEPEEIIECFSKQNTYDYF